MRQRSPASPGSGFLHSQFRIRRLPRRGDLSLNPAMSPMEPLVWPSERLISAAEAMRLLGAPPSEHQGLLTWRTSQSARISLDLAYVYCSYSAGCAERAERGLLRPVIPSFGGRGTGTFRSGGRDRAAGRSLGSRALGRFMVAMAGAYVLALVCPGGCT
jgi:hypothetical protein